MKRLYRSFLCWWFARTIPSQAPLTSLAAGEQVRKMRLLSILLLLALLLSLPFLLWRSLIRLDSSTIQDWLEQGGFLLALWLNRRGHLKSATLAYFFGMTYTSFLAMFTLPLHDAIAMLWIWIPLVLPVGAAGLFLPAWAPYLLAVVENSLIFWYLLVEHHTQMAHLMSPETQAQLLLYICLLLYATATVAAVYAVTTKKAVIQADRAAELEQANAAQEHTHAALAQAYARVEQLATTDALTGLPNHGSLLEHLEKEVERSRRYGHSLSLLFFDGDHFKRVNDTYGHATGDVVLREMGERVRGVLRAGDTLGRYGGEEFLVLLPETEAEEASILAERMREAMDVFPMAMTHVDEGITVTISVGLASYPVDGQRASEVLEKADQAMYWAKRLGRNQIRTAAEVQRLNRDPDLMSTMHALDRRADAPVDGRSREEEHTASRLEIVYSLMWLLDLRDHGIFTHSHQVSDLASAIARELGLDEHMCNAVATAGLLHDIGKIAVPEALLQKAGHLTTSEWASIKQHPALGAQILEVSPSMQQLMPAIRHHHEHWDGSGYPDRLAGEQIPLDARIIGVAEAYEAMITTRPYQAARSSAAALLELERCAGCQFDPTVVQVLSALLARQQEVAGTRELTGTH
jgi:diguanylate cyclase (GGDEF)-like protein/putative nucleotidyltransferase with HDIG domain